MNMGKKVFGIFLPLLSAAWIFLSCARQADYVSILPGDASVVVSVDWSALARKSGLLGNAEAQRVFSGWLENGSGPAWWNDAAPWLAAPFASGLSLLDPMYIFFQPSTGTAGCVAKVSDRRRLEEAFAALSAKHLCAPLEDSGVAGYVQAFFGSHRVACFNGETFIGLSQTSPADTADVALLLKAFLQADASESVAHEEAFRRMCAKQSDLAVYAAMPEGGKPATALLPSGKGCPAWMEGTEVIGNLYFLEGRVRWEMETVAPDSLLEKQRQRAAFIRKLSSGYLEYFPASSLCYAGMGLEGVGLVEWLLSDPSFVMRSQDWGKRLGIDVKSVLASVKGDCVVGVPSLTADGAPAFVCFAEVDGSFPLDALHEAFAPKVREEAGGFWSVDAGRGMKLVYGIRDNVFFAAVDAAASEVWAKKKPSMADDWKWEAADACAFAQANVQGILELPLFNLAMSMGGAETALLRSALAMVDDVECAVTDINKVRMEVRMSGREENALKQWVDFALQWGQE